jgi:CheY-like chemotaxis protein
MGAPTILVVDDYPDALQVWEMYLRGAGFNVITAADGPAALAKATAHRPDVIVMDLELPGLSGIEVARRLRGQPLTQDIPLIAATGYSHAGTLNEARESGFDAIVVKPCDPEMLVAEIRRLLSTAEPPAASN